MPHQCVKCGTMFQDASSELLKGCHCGGKMFFFIKKEKLEQAKKEPVLNLKPDERKEMESDVTDMLSSKFGIDTPVILDLETIRVVKPGTYEIDLVQLFKGQPLIYKLEDGKYIIDLVESFRQLKK